MCVRGWVALAYRGRGDDDPSPPSLLGILPRISQKEFIPLLIRPPQFWGSKLAPAASATCNPDGKYPLDINKLLSSIIIQQNTDYPFYNLTHPWRHGYPSSGLRVPKVGLGAPPQPRYKTPSWIPPTRPSSHREEGERKYNDLTLINTTIASEFEVLERRLKVGINLLPLIFSL